MHSNVQMNALRSDYNCPSQGKAIKGGTARIVPNHSGFRKRDPLEAEKRPLPLFEIALVLVRFNHVASLILNGNHKIRLFTLSNPRSPCSEKP